jgi:hypothetical protein
VNADGAASLLVKVPVKPCEPRPDAVICHAYAPGGRWMLTWAP